MDWFTVAGPHYVHANFSQYGPGARYVSIYLAGQDGEDWGGTTGRCSPTSSSECLPSRPRLRPCLCRPRPPVVTRRRRRCPRPWPRRCRPRRRALAAHRARRPPLRRPRRRCRR